MVSFRDIFTLLSGANISLGPLLQSVLVIGTPDARASTNTFGNPSLFDEKPGKYYLLLGPYILIIGVFNSFFPNLGIRTPYSFPNLEEDFLIKLLWKGFPSFPGRFPILPN